MNSPIKQILMPTDFSGMVVFNRYKRSIVQNLFGKDDTEDKNMRITQVIIKV